MCGVRAVVDGGAELPNVDQVAASDLHDAPCIFSANVQKNGSPASSRPDAACYVIAHVVYVTSSVTIFLKIDQLA